MLKLGFHIKSSLMVLLVLSLVTSSHQSTAQTVYIPDFVDHQEVILDGMGNDMYFRTSAMDKILPNSQLEVGSGSFELYSRFPTNMAYHGSFTKDSVFTGVTGNTIYQTRNTTADDLQIRYRSSFYDLLSTNSTQIDEADDKNLNVFIKDDESYYFTFEVLVSQMIMFVFLMSQGDSGQFDLDLQVIDSQGNTFTTGRWQSTNEYVYIPMYAMADSYTARLSSNNHNGLLKEFFIMDRLDTIPVEQGYSEEGFSGRNSRFKLFEVNQMMPSVMKIGATTHTSGFLGTVDLRAFSATTNPFGTTLNNEIELVKNLDHAYISVVGTPLDDSDPFVKGNKEVLNLPEGFEVDYSFFIDHTYPDPLPLDQNFMAPPGDAHDTMGHFLYTPQTDTILSYNASANVIATFTPLDGSAPFSANSNSNDILNNNVDNIFVVPAGEYIVDVAGNTMHYFTEMPVSSFPRESSQDLNLGLLQPQIFTVPVDGYNFVDSFNITYLDTVGNRTVTVSLSYYNSMGSYLGSDNFNMAYVIGNGTVTTSNNQTIHQLAGLTGAAPLQSYYIRIEQTGNIRYNTSDVDPVGNAAIDAVNEPNYVGSFTFRLINDIETQQDNDPDLDIFVMDLGDVNSEFLNASASDILAYLNFVSQADKAYRIVLEFTNISLSDVFFYRLYNSRLDLSPLGGFTDDASFSTATTVDGTRYERVELEFISLDNFTRGLHLDFNMGSAIGNGTLTVSIESSDIYEIGPVPITPFVFPESIEFEPEPTVGSQITVGIVLLALLAVPVLFLVRNNLK